MFLMSSAFDFDIYRLWCVDWHITRLAKNGFKLFLAEFLFNKIKIGKQKTKKHGQVKFEYSGIFDKFISIFISKDGIIYSTKFFNCNGNVILINISLKFQSRLFITTINIQSM